MAAPTDATTELGAPRDGYAPDARITVHGTLHDATREAPVADGVWVVPDGVPRTINVLLVRDPPGVLAFDAGAASMAPAIRRAAARLGGLTRVVPSHGHAEGDGGARYLRLDRLRSPARLLRPRVPIPPRDGGPIAVAATDPSTGDVARRLERAAAVA
jgi:glyoxylase-like metal-dependent hydrolase (beta-lactamase superfamily II)